MQLRLQMWFLLVGLLAVAEPGEAACLSIKLIEFKNRYNTVQNPDPSCCEGNCFPTKNELTWKCRGRSQCDHSFRVTLKTNSKTINSEWSGWVEEDNSYIKFGAKFGYDGVKNDFKICQPMDDGLLTDGQKIKEMKKVTFTVDVEDYDLPNINYNDPVTSFETTIDPMKVGADKKNLCLFTAWTNAKDPSRHNCEQAPFYLMIEPKMILDDDDPPEFKTEYPDWAKGREWCTTDETHGCIDVSASSERRLADGGGGVAATPRLAVVVLQLVAALAPWQRLEAPL